MIRTMAAASLFIFCVVLGASPAVSGAQDKVTLVVDDNYPPYSEGTPQQASGLYPKLLEAVFSRSGIEVEIQALPWEQALRAGEEGKAAVGGIYKNNTRLKLYDYSDPFFEESLAVYVKKGKAFRFDAFSDLQGKIVGLNRGWSYGEDLDSAREKHQFKVEESASNLQNFKKLISGEIDCLIADQMAAAQIVHRENWSDQVEQLDKFAAVNQVYLVFAKPLKRQNVLESFNQALAEMKKDGSYQRLVRGVVEGGSD